MKKILLGLSLFLVSINVLADVCPDYRDLKVVNNLYVDSTGQWQSMTWAMPEHPIIGNATALTGISLSREDAEAYRFNSPLHRAVQCTYPTKGLPITMTPRVAATVRADVTSEWGPVDLFVGYYSRSCKNAGACTFSKISS